MAERKSIRDRVKGSQPAVVTPDDFIQAANKDNQTTEQPWAQYDKKATPRYTFNLRVNDYELGLLRWLAEQSDGESMQRIAKRALIPTLEELAQKFIDNKS